MHNRLLEFARLALLAAEHVLPAYPHKFAPKMYTQPQLLACLLLKEYLRLDYRLAEEVIDTSEKLRTVLGLKRAPRQLHTLALRPAQAYAGADRAGSRRDPPATWSWCSIRPVWRHRRPFAVRGPRFHRPLDDGRLPLLRGRQGQDPAQAAELGEVRRRSVRVIATTPYRSLMVQALGDQVAGPARDTFHPLNITGLRAPWR